MAALCWLLQLTSKTWYSKYQFFVCINTLYTQHHMTSKKHGKTKSGKSLIPVRSALRRSGVNSWENAWVPGFRRTPSMSRKIAKDESCTKEEMSREDQTASYCVFQKKEICKVCNLERLKTEGLFHHGFSYVRSIRMLPSQARCYEQMSKRSGVARQRCYSVMTRLLTEVLSKNGGHQQGRSKIKIIENRMLFNASWGVA